MQTEELWRVKKMIKWLIFSDYGDSEKEIAEIMGYKKSSFSQILNGRVPLSDKFINNLSNIDKNINKVWIKTGKGKMFKQDENDFTQKFSSSEAPSNNTEINLLRKQVAILEENRLLRQEIDSLKEYIEKQKYH
ncbi:hypothetical protein [Riemerella columbina]|uniref:hypothetical protein n=1 Tax=Riemerella columbina TaxID=103810 RepID=UPI00036408AD|nr:hypothetical protein [Riemerella columbina]